MKTNGNDSASAIFLQNGLTHDSHTETGLTKREYFAGLAMQGMISNSRVIYAMTSAAKTETAKFAVELADALIAELNKTQP